MRLESAPGLPCDNPAVVAAAQRALSDPDEVADRLIRACSGGPSAPGDLIAAAWVFDPAWQSTVLVFHQRFQVWMPPGGRVEPVEDPLAAARRELFEETGLASEPFTTEAVLLDEWIEQPDDGEPTESYGLTYVFVTQGDAELTGEADQPAAWFSLAEAPLKVEPRHWARVVEFAASQRP